MYLYFNPTSCSLNASSPEKTKKNKGYKIVPNSLHTCWSTLEKVQLAQVAVTLSQLHVSHIPGEQLPPTAGDIKPSRFDHAKYCGDN